MRGRKAAHIKGIQHYDFDKLAKTTFSGICTHCEGKTFMGTVIAIRVRLGTLINWVKQFMKEGLKGLKDKAGRGASPFLANAHRQNS